MSSPEIIKTGSDKTEPSIGDKWIMPPNTLPIDCSLQGEQNREAEVWLYKYWLRVCETSPPWYTLICLFVQAEARLAARRQARYEARNIRMRELEKKQKEDEDTTTNNHTGVNSSGSGPHSLIKHTSSNSNHNNSNIHSAAGKSGFFHSMHSCRVQ